MEALYGLLGRIGSHSGVRRLPGSHGAVDLVRGDMQHDPGPDLAGQLERGQHQVRVVADERDRIGDRPVDVGFAGHGHEVVDVPDAGDRLGAERDGQVVGDDLDALLPVRVPVEDLGDPVGLALMTERVGGDYAPVSVGQDVLEQVMAYEAARSGQ